MTAITETTHAKYLSLLLLLKSVDIIHPVGCHNYHPHHPPHSPSSTGLDCSSCSFTLSMSCPLPEAAATYCMITLLASVTRRWKTIRTVLVLSHPNNSISFKFGSPQQQDMLISSFSSYRFSRTSLCVKKSTRF